MAGTTISSSTTVGVTLSAASQNPLTVTSSGTINVAGSYASAVYAVLGVPGTVTNSGTILAPGGYGIRLHSGGTVTNGSTANTTALISGGIYGIRFDIHGAGKLTNFGTITSTSSTTGSGVIAFGAGTVVNGNATSTAATISGYDNGVLLGGKGTVTNFGKIIATSVNGNGVYERSGGTVTNGSSADTTALISGGLRGVFVLHPTGQVNNFGTIESTSATGRQGVVLVDGGSVVNGSTSDTAATIKASGTTSALYIGQTSGTVTNFGTIASSTNTAVFIRAVGTVTNGSATDKSATITASRIGVYIQGAGSKVTNFGTITGGRNGISLYLGGTVTNGSSADTTALISGSSHSAVYLGAGSAGSLLNFGTITGTTSTGVTLEQGGTLVNGSTSDTAARIASTSTVGPHSAVYIGIGSVNITNFGTIDSGSASGIHIGNGVSAGVGTVVNFGTVEGTTGIYFNANSAGTVTNAGAIISSAGTTGTAILFGAKNDKLIVDSTASFVGKVIGGAGSNTLELAAGSGGAIGLIGTQFSNFSTLTVDSGGAWLLTNSNSIANTVNNGTVTIGNAATLNAGAIAASSTGVFDIGPNALLDILADTGNADKIAFAGASILRIEHAAQFGTGVGTGSYQGPLIEQFVSGDTIDLRDVTATGVVLNYTTATGLLSVSNGTTVLADLHIDNATLGSGTFHEGNDGTGHLTITHS